MNINNGTNGEQLQDSEHQQKQEQQQPPGRRPLVFRGQPSMDLSVVVELLARADSTSLTKQVVHLTGALPENQIQDKALMEGFLHALEKDNVVECVYCDSTFLRSLPKPDLERIFQSIAQMKNLQAVYFVSLIRPRPVCIVPVSVLTILLNNSPRLDFLSVGLGISFRFEEETFADFYEACTTCRISKLIWSGVFVSAVALQMHQDGNQGAPEQRNDQQQEVFVEDEEELVCPTADPFLVALSKSPSLEYVELRIDANAVSVGGMKALMTGSSIQQLQITPIRCSWDVVVDGLLSNQCSIRCLDMHSSAKEDIIPQEVVEKFFHAVEANSSIHTLRLTCIVNFELVQALCSTFSVNKTIQVVELDCPRRRPMSEKSLEAIVGLLEKRGDVLVSLKGGWRDTFSAPSSWAWRYWVENRMNQVWRSQVLQKGGRYQQRPTQVVSEGHDVVDDKGSRKSYALPEDTPKQKQHSGYSWMDVMIELNTPHEEKAESFMTYKINQAVATNCVLRFLLENPWVCLQDKQADE